MALNIEPSPISLVKERLDEVKYDPTLLIQANLELIEQLTNEEGTLVDASHPAVVLLEFSACEAANNLQETVSLLRKQYPILAETPEDIYRHMSDSDYLNRFASPSKTKISFAILVADLYSKLVFDSAEDCFKAVIPRDTKFTVDNTVFTLCYPIVIRRYTTNAIQITYDTTIPSPIQTLNEVVISAKVRTAGNNESWLFFDIDVVQVNHTTTNFVLERIYNFKKTVGFTDMFHHARVFFKNSNTLNQWSEMTTTHTEQVFDPTKATAVLQVLENTLVIRIPIIYFTNNLISGELRVDVYTTKGAITMNLQNYSQDDFGAVLSPIDEVRDHTLFVDAFSNISYYVYSQSVTEGGKSSLSFEDLRKRVIYNAVGPQVIPITNTQVEATANNDSYEIVKNVDIVTNRIFLATRKLPKPTNAKLITPANVGIVTYVTILQEIIDSDTVIRNGDRLTLRSNSLFIRENGRIRLLSNVEKSQLLSLGQTSFVSKVNENEYLYTPFYYILDESGEEFEMRVYNLDRPTAKDLSFERINNTLQLFVNTSSYSFVKLQGGYKLTIVTNSGTYFKSSEDNVVGVQLAFTPESETTYAYINGTMVGKTSSNERIYEFFIETNHDVSANDEICITNAEVQGVTDYKAWVNLTKPVKLIYYTTVQNANFIADETDQLLGKFMLPAGSVANSLETIDLVFGYSLKNLWRRGHSYLNDTQYVRYEHDIPLTYENDVYDIDPVTGSVFDIVDGEVVYNVLHHAGDPVLDEEGSVVYKHMSGEIILDENGNPITVANVSIGREIDILVSDAKYYFADDAATVEYRNEIMDIITSWVTNDLKELKNNLIEQTEIYFYPKTTVGEVFAYVDNNELVQMSAEQELTVELHVPSGIYRNEAIRKEIRNNTTSMIDQYISKPVVNITELNDALKTMYGDSVIAFKINGLGGSDNYTLVTMKDGRYKLSLKKRLVIQADKKMFVEDGVTYEFKQVNTV